MAPGATREQWANGLVTVIGQGDCRVASASEIRFSTVLGSCISACVRDRVAMVGGMNHFLLASRVGPATDQFSGAARYGAFAMEQLINMVLAEGTGRKANLEFKVFGGGNIQGGTNDVGLKNIEFVREFLAREGYAITSGDMGGAFARKVLYQPTSGRVLIKRLDSTEGASLARRELAIARREAVQSRSTDIELF